MKKFLHRHPGMPFILIFLFLVSGSIFRFYISAKWFAGFGLFTVVYGFWLMETHKDEKKNKRND